MQSIRPVSPVYICVASMVMAVLGPQLADAQAADGCPVATSSAAARSIHASSGLQVVINSINKSGPAIAIQTIVQNQTSTRQYVLFYGANKASFDNGNTGNLQNTNGINACAMTGNDQTNLSRCRDEKSRNLDAFSYIEPCEFTALTAQYIFNSPAAVQTAKTVSFSVDLLARGATGRADAPSPTAAAARPVVINFPLTPLQASN